MHDDKSRIELVFNPRKLSVALVEAELAKRPDLTIDQLKAMLAHEGTQVRPRKGVERALDARLLALAEEAIEAASEDMTAEGAPDPEEEEPEVEGAAEEAEVEDEVEEEDEEEAEVKGPFGVEGPEAVSDVQEAESDDAPPRRGTKGPDLLGILGEMTAERLAEFGLCRMMGPDPDDPMAPEGYVEPEAEETPENDQSDIPAITANTPVHVTMTNGQVHEGYYVRAQSGAMIRMRDGQDTVIFVPDDSFWVSPSDNDGGD